ncbi:MAG TPA: hypothetical protein VHR39_21995, partial [Propionibacteriaceae bacterium]|nr:hypothetical protein [Propionibacteriaceae bacterium]
MNPLSLILGFLPLIAFNLLAGRVAHNGIAWGALVALAIALINMAITRPRWPPKIINLILASLFLVLTLIGFLGNRSINGWLVDWASGLVTVTLGLLLLVTMPIMPFTEQYARERVPREYWADPHSKGQPSAQPGVGSRHRDHRAGQHGCGTPPRAGRLEVQPRPAGDPQLGR